MVLEPPEKSSRGRLPSLDEVRISDMDEVRISDMRLPVVIVDVDCSSSVVINWDDSAVVTVAVSSSPPSSWFPSSWFRMKVCAKFIVERRL
jgi:hypothetical protein